MHRDQWSSPYSTDRNGKKDPDACESAYVCAHCDSWYYSVCRMPTFWIQYWFFMMDGKNSTQIARCCFLQWIRNFDAYGWMKTVQYQIFLKCIHIADLSPFIIIYCTWVCFGLIFKGQDWMTFSFISIFSELYIGVHSFIFKTCFPSTVVSPALIVLIINTNFKVNNHHIECVFFLIQFPSPLSSPSKPIVMSPLPHILLLMGEFF